MGLFSLTPGGAVGDLIKTALTGPLIGGMVDGYKAKLSAENTADKLLADLAGRELELEQRQRELNVQMMQLDEGRWWTAAPRAIVQWSFALFIAKCVVWDKIIGIGTTDPLTGQVGEAFALVIGLWFGGRSLEKMTNVVATRFGKR